MNAWAEFVSLFLTWPAIVMGSGVLHHSAREAWANYRQPDADRPAYGWLVMGIFIGFLGGNSDNTYWGWAWTLRYIEFHEWADVAFMNGVYPNIIFRQTCSILAAYCHLRAFFFKHPDGMRLINRWMAVSGMVGLIYVFALLAYRQMAGNL